MTKHPIGEQLSNSLPLFVKGEPYTIEEIDQHPDRERICCTIQEVGYYLTLDLESDLIYTQKEMDEALDEEYDRGFRDGKYEADDDYDSDYNDGYNEGIKELNAGMKEVSDGTN